MESSLIQVGAGGFVVASRPRGGDCLREDLHSLANQGFTIIVSLLTEPEVEELSLKSEANLCQQLGLDFRSFPIPDRCLPASRSSFGEFADEISQILASGGRGFFHCRAGIGRAPLLGCQILVNNGSNVGEAWQMLERHRGQEIPDTAEQRGWVKSKGQQPLDLFEALRLASENL